MGQLAEILILETLRRMEADIQAMKTDMKYDRASLIEFRTQLIVIKRQRTV